MNKKPVIGITCAQMEKSTEVASWTIKVNILKNDNVFKIAAAGAIPIIIPVNASNEDITQYADMIDGLYITGGSDINPQLYGETPHEKTAGIDPMRDSTEIALFNEVRKINKPILGICRGCQLINVAMGGKLIQDIKTRDSNALMHMQDVEPKYPSHSIEIESNSVLNKILGLETCLVNSLHHQAVREDCLPSGLRVSARASDGIVEAIEDTHEDGTIIGIQWHPENMSNPCSDEIYKYFVEKCKNNAKL